MEENILYREHPSMFRNHPFGFILSFALIIVGVGLIILLIWWLQCLSKTLIVSDIRTTLREGILSKRTIEVYHSDVRSVEIDQSFLKRIFNVGTVAIASAGTGRQEIVISGMFDPEYIKESIDTHRSVH